VLLTLTLSKQTGTAGRTGVALILVYCLTVRLKFKTIFVRVASVARSPCNRLLHGLGATICCTVSVQPSVAWSQCNRLLHGLGATICCTVSVQPSVARSPCKRLLHGLGATVCCTVSVQPSVARSRLNRLLLK